MNETISDLYWCNLCGKASHFQFIFFVCKATPIPIHFDETGMKYEPTGKYVCLQCMKKRLAY